MATVNGSNAALDAYETGVPGTDGFYSVEIPIEKADLMYQFKIWRDPTVPNFVLIKQGSAIINWIHPGDIFRMTYHGDDFAKPKRQLPTRILNIHRQDVGRFRGHYMVTLGIV